MKKKLTHVILLLALLSLSACGASDSKKKDEPIKKAPENLVINTKEPADSDDAKISTEDSVSSSEPAESEESNVAKPKTEVEQPAEGASYNTAAPASNNNSTKKQEQDNRDQTQTETTPSLNTNVGGSIGGISTPDGWLTSDGYYHRSSSCDGSDSDFSSFTIMQWHEAKEAGYQPCPDCNPV